MRKTEPDSAESMSNSADNLQLIVPNLHRRYSGVTATNRMVAPKLASIFRAAWLGPDAPDGIARMGVAHLLKLWRRRKPLIWHARRNNEMIAGVLLQVAGLAAETGVHLGGAAPPQLDHAVADPPDGRDHRDQRYLGVVPQAPGDRDHAWRRYRSLCAALRSRRGVRGDRIAGPLCDRLLRPGARAKGHRCLRRGDVRAAAALSRFYRRHGRRDYAGANGVCQRSEKADRGSRPAIAHRHHRRTADRGGAALVSAADDLRLHLAQ